VPGSTALRVLRDGPTVLFGARLAGTNVLSNLFQTAALKLFNFQAFSITTFVLFLSETLKRI
jgi:hypothetical protein